MSTITWKEFNDGAEAIMLEKGKFFRYKCRAECFIDVIEAFKLLFDRRGFKVIKPIITGSMFGCADVEFYSDQSISKIINVWKEGCDIHRLWQTLNFADKYDARVINE
jgi:hypothetical protein